MSIIANINAVVEKLAGKIRIKVMNTGNQSSQSEDLKVIATSLVLDKYLATNMNNTTDANVDVWNDIPIKGT
jgi:cell division protein ZapA (FtsZ GTPase activity inhibitor)